MSSVQIYTNTSNAHFATTTGGADGALTVASLASASAPTSHLIRSTKPNATAFPNSLFIGSSLNYLRIKILTDGASNLVTVPVFHIYGWSQELKTRYWEARKIATLTPNNATCATSGTFTMPGLTGSWREIFEFGAASLSPPAPPIPTSGEGKIYIGDLVGGGGFFLIDTIGTEMIEIHITRNTGGTQPNFAALCAGL
jgi:hypothetical protein